MKKYRPVILIVQDGWGIREMAYGNSIVQANTPNYDHWLRNYERSILEASGEAVGLTKGQMGNSEVGHLNLGAGFTVYQEITRIDKAIEEGKFSQNPILLNAIQKVKQNKSKMHLIGLLGPGGIHSHTRHLFALLDIAQEHDITPVIHVITDGRDTPPNSGIEFVKELEAYVEKTTGVIATVEGRYYIMDRDKRWERTKRGYDALTTNTGLTARTAHEAVEQSYEEEVFDEFIKPTIIEHKGDEKLTVSENDCLLFFNFRADRMRQIVRAFAYEDFNEFERSGFIKNLDILTLTEYESDFPAKVLFPKHNVSNPLARVISENNLKQYHAAETEKYAHVTFFFNGGREEPFEGEERLLIPSPKVATYDLQPEMSAQELTDKVLERLQKYDDDFMIINFANPDMVGHTGFLDAAIKAVETVDHCTGQLVEAVLKKGGAAVVTADHGNAERVNEPETGAPHTYHTTSPVSMFVVSDAYVQLQPSGILSDVAPTILYLLGLQKPAEMTSNNLIIV